MYIDHNIYILWSTMLIIRCSNIGFSKCWPKHTSVALITYDHVTPLLTTPFSPPIARYALSIARAYAELRRWFAIHPLSLHSVVVMIRQHLPWFDCQELAPDMILTWQWLKIWKAMGECYMQKMGGSCICTQFWAIAWVPLDPWVV